MSNFELELKGLKGLRNLENFSSAPRSLKDSTENIQSVPIECLVSGKYQPRQQWNEAELLELADSIKAHGILQPLIVRVLENEMYEIIAGERRWRAAKLAGLSKVTVIVRHVEDNVALAFALIENIQRQNLSPLEEAAAFSRFKEEFAMTHQDIANMVGRSRASVTNTMRLLSLCDGVKKLLEAGKIEMGHARSLLTLDENQQICLADKIVAQGLTVRQTEKVAEGLKHQYRVIEPRKVGVENDEKQAFLATKLAKKCLAPVSLKVTNTGSVKVIIHFKSLKDVDSLIERIDET